MKKINILLAVILIFGSFSQVSYSQGGSNYSNIGIGDLNPTISAAYEGLSGTSIAMPNEMNINFSNPALLSLVSTTRLQAGYRFNQNIISDANSSLWQNNGGINDISMVFAFDTTNKIAGSFGIIPITKVNYLIAKEFSLETEGETINGTSTFKGSGGISSIYLSLGGKLFTGLYAGATIYGNIGSINYLNQIDYENNFAYTTYYIQHDYFSGLGYKFGLFYETPWNLNIGAYYHDYGKFNVNRDFTQGNILLDDSVQSEKFSTSSPRTFGLGLSYRTGKFLMGVDYKSVNAVNLNYGLNRADKFTSGSELSFGLVREGKPRKDLNMSDRTDFRLGFAYSKLYYEIAQQNINEIKASLGFGIPFSTTGMFDFALILGHRGTTDNGLVSEYFARFVFDISIGEGWFHPFKREF
ncbi:MAG: hypothetical protein A2X64_08350 [Ignavibacteria bacterium GWF2_33_9]|nr:MAG: hypothetical protein A2X64_08350 [Ignavibacteria bacterium GWF2_33_9]